MGAPAGAWVAGVALGFFWGFLPDSCAPDPDEGVFGPGTPVASSSSSSAASTSAGQGGGGEGGSGGAGGIASSTTTGVGGEGGQGGAPECVTAVDCGENGPCGTWACFADKCLHSVVAQGKPVDGADGDCISLACDGQGGIVESPDPSDVPADVPNDCTSLACDAQGAVVASPDPADVPADDGNDCTVEACAPGPVHPDAPKGASCATNGGNLCDAGECVPFIPVKCKSDSTGQVYVGCEGKIHVDYNTITVDVVGGFSCGSHDLPAFGYCAPGTPCSIWHVGKPADGGECQ